MRRLLRIVLWSGVAVAALAGLVAFALWREITRDLPSVDELRDYRPPTATRIYAADGTPIGEFYVERRYLVSLDRVPAHVRRAFLAAEDAGFRRHRGVDPAGIARAVLANLRHRAIVQGASTITQQVVKQLLLSPERTVERKAKELILALDLESKLSKDEIFTLYLNHIYFGAGAYGIAAAARAYFDADPSELSLAQAALLAGLPQAPSRYAPRRRPAAAKARRRYVLDRMLAAGFATPDEIAAAHEEPIALARGAAPVHDAAPWYVGHVRDLLVDEYGPGVARLGLEVHTAIDLDLQRAAEEAVRAGVRRIERRLGGRRGGPPLEGALVAMDPGSGQVKALVGGVDPGRSQWNRAIQARRQPGSAFKPFVYAAAIERGYTPATVVLDAPISLPDGGRGSWTPENFEHRYRGPVLLRTALEQSLNSVSVRLALAVGIDRLRERLRRFGFPTDFPRHLSLALGSSEVTLLDLTRAYGVFATSGRRFEPVFVTAVTDARGRPSAFEGASPRFEPVMDPATARVVTDMLRSVVEAGTARDARALGRPCAGKTGTTNESRDAWFIGFTPELLVGVWVGFDAGRSLGDYTGGRAAVPIWTAFMKRALAGRPVRELFEPDPVRVDAAPPAAGDGAPAAPPVAMAPEGR